MSDLKPCPFCGGEAHTYKNNLWHVACERAHNGCVTMSAFITEAEAIAAWNSRAERTCKLVETDRYTNSRETVHVLECSECGETCEHVNGIYPRCPHCGAKVERKD